MSDFFFDANISRRIANMLSALTEGSHRVVHITEHPDFLHNNTGPGANCTPDLEWITRLGSASGERWSVIKGEADIIDTAHERAALIGSGLTVFSLDHHWGKAGFLERAWKVVKVWGEIVKCAESPGPALYRVHRGKRLSVETVRPGRRARGGKFQG